MGDAPEGTEDRIVCPPSSLLSVSSFRSKEARVPGGRVTREPKSCKVSLPREIWSNRESSPKLLLLDITLFSFSPGDGVRSLGLEEDSIAYRELLESSESAKPIKMSNGENDMTIR